MAWKLVGDSLLSVRVWDVVYCLLVDHNFGIERIVLVNKIESLNDVAMFHPELSESIWTDLVGLENNSYG